MKKGVSRKKYILLAISLAVAALIAVEIITPIMQLNTTESNLIHTTKKTVETQADAMMQSLNKQGFVNLKKVMEVAGFVATDISTTEKYTFSELIREYDIQFDFLNSKIIKDLYSYTIPLGSVFFYLEECYIKTDFLSKILSQPVIINNQDIIVEEKSITNMSWIAESKFVVAHGGGILRHNGELFKYTNGMEAIVQAYDQGCRVFEIDLGLTSDDEIALMHDWKSAGFPDGAPTAAQWLNHQYRDQFKTYLIEDLYRAMSINKDMYMIPHPKFKDQSDKEIKAFYQLMVDKANKIDLDVARRIVPALFNSEMYPLLREVYDFPSMLYTTYATTDTMEEVVDFVRDKDDIPVILSSPSRWSLEFTQNATAANKLHFLHTYDKPEDIAHYMNLGISGFLSNNLTPSSMQDVVNLYGLTRNPVSELALE